MAGLAGLVDQPVSGGQASVLGIDVGGANLKLATDRGDAASVRFDLWRHPERLADVVRDAAAGFLPTMTDRLHLAVTMTGELADCYASRAEGVGAIVSQLRKVIDNPRWAGASIYQIGGDWYDIHDSIDWTTVASGNWDATSRWLVSEVLPTEPIGDALLIDIGSTTTDLIPIRGGVVDAGGTTDRQRLATGTLVYIGVGRTPVCALRRVLPVGGRPVPICNEVFATIDDARLILGLTKPTVDGLTADGRPRDVAHAAVRLGRMVGSDGPGATPAALREAAESVVGAARRRIGRAIDRQIARLDHPTLVWAGEGAALVRSRFSDFGGLEIDQFGPNISGAVAAFAVARLYAQRRIAAR